MKFSSESLSTLILNLKSNSKIGSPPLHFISAHAFVEGAKSVELKKVFDMGRLICDSKPLSIYLNLFIKKTPQVRGSDFMREFLMAAPIASKHFFLGGTEETLKGIEDYVKTLRGKDLSCVFESPDFEVPWSSSSKYWISKIESERVDFVWVGMGAPRQFHISAEIYNSLQIPVFSVGAAFDFIAGTKPECPKVMRKIGMEWFFRFLTEPRRLWKRYLIGNFEFLIILLRLSFSIRKFR